jgi:hypothetical protein
VASDVASLPALLERFVEAGASKFVVVPIGEPSDWSSHLAEVADVVKPVET